jgi:hypothetical protein
MCFLQHGSLNSFLDSIKFFPNKANILFLISGFYKFCIGKGGAQRGRAQAKVMTGDGCANVHACSTLLVAALTAAVRERPSTFVPIADLLSFNPLWLGAI